MRPSSFRRLAICAIVLSLAAMARGDELRTWTSGRVTIKAKFVSVEEGKVTLAKEDGDEVEIDLKKLSTADQKYVADREKMDDDSPFKAKPNDPFKAKSKKSAGKAKGGAGEGKVFTPDWSGVNEIAVTAGGDWNVPVGEAPDVAKVVKLRPIPVARKADFFEKTEGLVVSTDGKRAAIGYDIDEPRPDGLTRLVVLDLENSKPVGSASTSGKMAPLAMSDDGSQVLMKRNEFGFGKADRLELWSLDESGIKKELVFEPYNNANGGDRDVKWGAFLGDKKIATVSNKGRLAVWELGTSRPLYTMDMADGGIPALSPDRKLLAFATGKEVGILEVASGTVLALQSRPQSPWPVMAFSPSGKRFALASMDKLWAWETSSGAAFCEMLLTGLFVNGKVQFTAEDDVLVGGQYLVDVANQVKLWQYEPSPGNQPVTASAGGVVLFYEANGADKPGALVPAKLPQPAAKSLLDKAIADPNFVILKPGTTVRLDVSRLSDPSEKAKVMDALGARLSTNGDQVGPNGTIDLVASTETGQVQERTYRSFRGGGAQTYKVQEYITRIRFVYQGKVAWETSGSNILGIVTLKEGQTVDAYLREHEKPNYDFFTHVELPKKLTKPSGGVTLGKSTVSPAGIR